MTGNECPSGGKCWNGILTDRRRGEESWDTKGAALVLAAGFFRFTESELTAFRYGQALLTAPVAGIGGRVEGPTGGQGDGDTAHVHLTILIQALEALHEDNVVSHD